MTFTIYSPFGYPNNSLRLVFIACGYEIPMANPPLVLRTPPPCLAATLFLRLNNIRSVICQFSRRSRRLTVKDIVHLGKLLPQHCLGDLKQLLVGTGEVNRSTVHHDGSRRHLADGLVQRKKLTSRTCCCWTDPPPMVEEAC